MKVKDLIKLLQDEDQELEVFSYDHEWGYNPVGNITIHRNFEYTINLFTDNRKVIKVEEGLIT
jgi:hypothetical protein